MTYQENNFNFFKESCWSFLKDHVWIFSKIVGVFARKVHICIIAVISDLMLFIFRQLDILHVYLLLRWSLYNVMLTTLKYVENTWSDTLRFPDNIWNSWMRQCDRRFRNCSKEPSRNSPVSAPWFPHAFLQPSGIYRAKRIMTLLQISIWNRDNMFL